MARQWRWELSGLIAVGLVLALPPAALAQQRTEFSDEAVGKAIEKAVKCLWSMYSEADGHWPEIPNSTAESNLGGHTALVAYALLAADVSRQDPRMKKALEWLASIDSKSTYTLGLRCQVWQMLVQQRDPGQARKFLEKDVVRLIKSCNQPAKGHPVPTDIQSRAPYGTYTYVCNDAPPGGGYDHSNTQYGILGVWAGARALLEVIPKEYWEMVFQHWVITQNADGGWSYGYDPSGAGASSGTMTAAGLASMFVAVDQIAGDLYYKCGNNPDQPTIKKGLDWFDKNFGGAAGGYYLYGVERVGLASGYKYFGKKDWYKICATQLINSQGADGGWGGGHGGDIETAYCLLFLVRGRNPVLFNRLQYDGDWNNRPRGLANLSRWISQDFEREVSWQIITLKVDVEEWHDAPILLITGCQKPTFTPADLDKLRRYVYEGGMILSVTEGGGQGFEKEMRDVYRKLFPDYELRQVPADHQMFRYPRDAKKMVGKVSAISNGIRLLAAHCTEDLPLAWQKNTGSTEAESFAIAFNIAFFATDKASLRYRGVSNWPSETPVTPLRMAKVARIKYTGNYDPEPLAWERLRILMGQKWQTKLQVGEPMTLDQLKGGDYRVAAITGTTQFALSDEEKKALKAFVDGGGTVILDAAGGSEAFADSAAKMLEELFGAESLKKLPGSSPVYQLKDMAIGTVKYRRALAERLSDAKAPRVMGIERQGRVAVFLSKEDLTSGLVGYPCSTSLGYDPRSAVELMRNMVLYGMQAERPAAETATPGDK